MIALNLIANGNEQIRIKNYLENNVSEILAQKINKGVPYTKDNKEYLNKKDLNGFMKYACDEARNLAAKDARCACIEDTTVFGWAIHYFEEDEILGNLYNLDGTPLKQEPPKPKIENKPVEKKKEEPKQIQLSLFDILNQSQEEQPKVEPIKEPVEIITSDGEITNANVKEQDSEKIKIIQEIFGGNLNA